MQNEDILVYQEQNREMHPEWTANQVDMKSALDLQADKLIDEGHKDINDELLELLIRRAQQWIADNLPALFERVRHVFSYLYDHLGEWIGRGIEYIAEIISNINIF